MAHRTPGQRSKKGNKRASRTRKRTQCQRYRNEGRREKNKRQKLERHLRDNPQDSIARQALADL